MYLLTIKDIAGYCREELLWDFIIDVAREMQTSHFMPTEPEHVLISNTKSASFCLADNLPTSEDDSERVWNMAALAFFISTGHLIFGGKGISYQIKHPGVKLPTMIKEHASINSLFQQCTNSDPHIRPSLQELISKAEEERKKCILRLADRPLAPLTNDDLGMSPDSYDRLWPEEMTAIKE